MFGIGWVEMAAREANRRGGHHPEQGGVISLQGLVVPIPRKELPLEDHPYPASSSYWKLFDEAESILKLYAWSKKVHSVDWMRESSVATTALKVF